MSSAESARALRVVFVCTGNRARSPLAAELFRRAVGGAEVSVTSAGTLEIGSLPALPQAIEAALELGIDLGPHRSRSLHWVDLRSADLVLGFEPHHAAAAAAAGARPERTFLLSELVELMHSSNDAGAPADVRGAIVRAHDRRAGSSASLDIIPDPMGRPAEVMRSTAREINRLVSQLASKLFA